MTEYIKSRGQTPHPVTIVGNDNMSTSLCFCVCYFEAVGTLSGIMTAVLSEPKGTVHLTVAMCHSSPCTTLSLMHAAIRLKQAQATGSTASQAA